MPHHAGVANDAAKNALVRVQLAQHHDTTLDPALYWVSEKLDGVRAVWDGQQLLFRSGRVIAAPAWFIAGFPSHALDGELWIARRAFDPLSATVRKNVPDDSQWQQVRYMVFDLPAAAGDFTTRLQMLETSIEEAGVPWLQLVPQFRVQDHAALESMLTRIVAEGGEGVMLHRADAAWQSGRTDALRKLTPLHDAEATVIGHVAGKGRLRGMVGALVVQTDDGVQFRLGSGLSDAQRQAPPAIGTRITYRYREKTENGVPRFASFWRVRDLP